MFPEPQTLVPTAGGTCLDFFVTDDGGGIGGRLKNEPTEFLGAVEAMDALKGIVVSFHPVELCDVLLLELGGSRPVNPVAPASLIARKVNPSRVMRYMG